jgi:hypothetical protein
MERILFINEIFSFLGLLLFFNYMVSGKKDKTINNLPLCLVFYCCIHAFYAIIIYEHNSIYEKIRTLPIWYSIFSIFIGYFVIFPKLTKIINTKKYTLAYPYILLTGLIFGAKIMLPAAFALTLPYTNKKKIFFATLLILTAIIMPFKIFFMEDYHNDMTIYISIMALCLFFLNNKLLRIFLKYPHLHYFLLSAALVVIIFLKIIANSWSNFYYDGYLFFQSISDPNTIWRLMFWAKTINEMSAQEWIFGIGLGQPIYDIDDITSQFIYEFNPNDPYLPYTLGLHNSFLTFFVRMGFIGLFLLITIVTFTLRKLSMIHDEISNRILIALILLCIATLFNVVLETPLFASIFWITIGMGLRKVHEHRSYTHA